MCLIAFRTGTLTCTFQFFSFFGWTERSSAFSSTSHECQRFTGWALYWHPFASYSSVNVTTLKRIFPALNYCKSHTNLSTCGFVIKRGFPSKLPIFLRVYLLKYWSLRQGSFAQTGTAFSLSFSIFLSGVQGRKNKTRLPKDIGDNSRISYLHSSD